VTIVLNQNDDSRIICRACVERTQTATNGLCCGRAADQVWQHIWRQSSHTKSWTAYKCTSPQPRTL